MTPDQQIACAIGICVLQSQELERLFKLIVPMTSSDDPSVAAILRRGAAISKKTLGAVAGDFVKAFSGDVAALKEQVAKVVSERNEVVHHFSERFGALLAANQHEEVLHELRQRQERASILFGTLRQIALAITEALRDTTYAGTNEYEGIAELCASLRPSQP
jgi:hypothetical protein